MTTQNTIEIASANNVITVPTVAIKMQNGKKTVRILNAQGQPENREVQTGLKDDMNTEIKSGLKEGEQVIISEMGADEKANQNNQHMGPPM